MRHFAGKTGNLMGTTRTLDGTLGDDTEEPIEPGLVSRDGWALRFPSTAAPRTK
jgi:hypothetical protein